MVPCQSNTSQSFPMFNELQNSVSQFYKCDSQDIFFDVLSTELNLEGVVYFYQHVFGEVTLEIEKHFMPVENSINEASSSKKLDISIANVLKKKYQSNWKHICSKVISNKYCEGLMNKIQTILAIADNENEDINEQISEYIRKTGEIAFQMMISDPPLLFDIKQIGKQVKFNQHKQDSLDGFIKTNEECFSILPSVFKLQVSNGSTGNSNNQNATSN